MRVRPEPHKKRLDSALWGGKIGAIVHSRRVTLPITGSQAPFRDRFAVPLQLDWIKLSLFNTLGNMLKKQAFHGGIAVSCGQAVGGAMLSTD